MMLWKMKKLNFYGRNSDEKRRPRMNQVSDGTYRIHLQGQKSAEQETSVPAAA
jgi:hypothetical protein